MKSPSERSQPNSVKDYVDKAAAWDAVAKKNEQITTLVKALQKVRNYNVDITGGLINYRPHDHIQIIDEALAAVENQS